MEGDIFSSRRATIDRGSEKKLYVNCLIKKKKKKKRQNKTRQSNVMLMTKYYSIRRCITIQSNVSIIEAPIESDTKLQ